MFETNDSNRNSQRIPAAPARAHVQALIDAGHTPRTIARAAGLETRRITILLSEHTERGESRRPGYEHRIARPVAERILAVPIPDGLFVCAVGPVRRLQALVRIGHPFYEIAAAVGHGYTGQVLAEIALGRPEIIDSELAAELAALYERWHLVPGTSIEARELGRENGFAAPLAWAVDEDDVAGSIDDPNAQPVGVERPDRRRWRQVPTDFTEIVADHRDLGHFDEEIATALDISLNTFAKRLHRAGLSERRRGDGNHAMIRPLYGARYAIRMSAQYSGAVRRMAGVAS